MKLAIRWSKLSGICSFAVLMPNTKRTSNRWVPDKTNFIYICHATKIHCTVDIRSIFFYPLYVHNLSVNSPFIDFGTLYINGYETNTTQTKNGKGTHEYQKKRISTVHSTIILFGGCPLIVNMLKIFHRTKRTSPHIAVQVPYLPYEERMKTVY